jgi:diaminopimelate epimerase
MDLATWVLYINCGMDHNNTSSTDKLIENIIDDCCAKLSEHCDSVQVFVTRYENGESKTYSCGTGNFYTRLGHVREWLMRKDAQAKEDAKQRSNEDES